MPYKLLSLISLIVFCLATRLVDAFQPHAGNKHQIRRERVACGAEGQGKSTRWSATTTSVCASPAPHIAFLGGGIFFYWQAGVVTYLKENGYDLTQTSSTGASAGALAATLSACDVDFYKATDLALQMAKDAGVWDRSGGLQGIWGPMIRHWLEYLLPQDAVSRMTANNTTLLVTTVPQCRKQRVASFTDRQDLIDCNMASVHLPLFLDGQWTTTFRDVPCIDGSFLSNPSDYGPMDRKRDTLFLSHRLDEKYNNKGLLSFVKAINPDGIYGMIEDGKSYAKTIEEQGKLADFPFLSSRYGRADASASRWND